MKIKFPILILIFMLGLISSRIVINQLVIPFASSRIAYETAVLENTAEPPYQYRVLQPAISHLFQTILSRIYNDPQVEHVITYSILLIFTFWIIYSLLALFLGTMFNETGVIIGLLLFQSLVPLSISGYYMEGDYFMIIFYLAVLLLMIYEKDAWIPLIILVAALNREQAVFILVFYGIYLFSKSALDQKHLWILASSFVAFLIAFVGIRVYFGFKPTQYTILMHISNNTNLANLFNLTLPLWFAEVLGMLILSIISFRKSNQFFKLSLISLAIYFAIFFLKGNLWEFAKFLPAFIIMIPMSVQTLVGQFTKVGLNSRINSILVSYKLSD